MSSDKERIIQIYRSLTKEISPNPQPNPDPSPINITDDTDNASVLIQRSIFDISANPPIGFINNKIEYMEKAYFEFWGKYPNITPENSITCGRFTYDLARKYVKFAKGTTSNPKGGNDARSLILRKHLIELGYTSQKVCQNATKTAIINRISSTIFFPGDIIIYYANDDVKSNRGNNHYVYGHTQIYTGLQIHREDEWLNSKSNELILKRKQYNVSFIKGPGPSSWSSSLRDNYFSSFVYSSSNIISTKWDLWIMRAP
jgi:hypothetical protein